jgi:cellulose synthase/poly-beta-1,6-N-acetylglucosamine synthase-like glycosyltransferase
MTSLTIIFWLSAAGIIYPYAIYPLLLRLLVIVKGKKPVEYPPITPTVSVLIPAYNEEAVIKEKVTTTLSIDYPREKLEVIVISDQSTDNTDGILSLFNDPRLKVIRLEKRSGKNQALSRAMKVAGGEIIVFTDANAIFDPDAIRELVRPFHDQTIGSVVGQLVYQNPKGNLIANLEKLYWSYDNLLKNWEGRLHTLLGANGSIFAIRRELWEPVDDMVHEDFIIPTRIIKRGFSNIYRPSARVREEASSTPEQEYSRRSRIVWKGWVAVDRTLGWFLHPPRWIMIFEIISRKAVKRLIWFFGGTLFISNIFLLTNTWYLYPFIAQMLFLAAAAGGRLQRGRSKKNRLCYYAYSIMALIGANLVGFLDYLRGRKPEGVWEVQRL